MRRSAAAMAAFLVIASVAFGQTPAPEVQQFVTISAPTVALTHVRVIDGTGAPARENQTVIIANGKITSLGGDSTVGPRGPIVFEDFQLF